MHTELNQVYVCHKPMTADQVLEKAAEIIATKFISNDVFTDAKATKEYLSFKLTNYDKELFAVMLLNTQHQLIEYRELFFGTIDSASIYPREVVKAVLEVNASAVIFAHNHPSGIAEGDTQFRDLSYYKKQGGYHPVEISMQKDLSTGNWDLLYISDFSYFGYPYPELATEFEFKKSPRI